MLHETPYKFSFISWSLQIKINLSKVLSEREFLLGVIVIPANEKNRSTGAEDGNVVILWRNSLFKYTFEYLNTH